MNWADMGPILAQCMMFTQVNQQKLEYFSDIPTKYIQMESIPFMAVLENNKC